MSSAYVKRSSEECWVAFGFYISFKFDKTSGTEEKLMVNFDKEHKYKMRMMIQSFIKWISMSMIYVLENYKNKA